MTPKHKELLTRGDTRAKELSAFIAEHGDNMTSENYAKGEVIRADLADIRSQVELCQNTEKMGQEAVDFGKFMNEPAAQHRSNGPSKSGVIGATRAGDINVKRVGKSLRAIRESGAGVFGKDTFAAIDNPDYDRAFRKYLKYGDRLASKHLRTLQDGLDPQGGFLAPTQWMAKLIERQPTPTRVAGLVDSMNCSSDSMSMPRVNYASATDDANGSIYTTGFRATLTDENPNSDTQANVNDANLFGSTRVAVYTYMLEGALTNNVIEDAFFDPMMWFDGKLRQTVDLLKDNVLINGSGINQPLGMLGNPTSTDPFMAAPLIYSGTAASPYFTPAALINMSEDIPEQYDENVRYLYKKTTTGKAIRGLQDGNGAFLFRKDNQTGGLANGRETEINGYPVTWSQFMPDPAAAPCYPVICGDLKGMCLVNRVGFSIQVLREVAARRNQVILVGRVRFGCQPIEPWRYRVMQVHA
jgi:HK97 family phage major capsid protein